MARRHSVTVLDDLDGSEGASTVRFGLDNRWYSVDLTPENETELREFLRRYVDAAVEGPEASERPARNTHEVRTWLRANGVQVPTRGRIPNVYLNMYDTKTVDPTYVTQS